MGDEILERLKVLNKKLDQRIKEINTKDNHLSMVLSNFQNQEEFKKLEKILFKYLLISSTTLPNRIFNLQELIALFLDLEIDQKITDIRELFIYKAMNISGISLKEEEFGKSREGRYVQIIAIKYETDKSNRKIAKNISLGYFGKAKSIDTKQKRKIIEFVLRWRYEKAFQNMQHYHKLLEMVTNI